jgi:hypothetical protein
MSKRGSLSTRTMVDFKSTPLEPLAFKARVVQLSDLYFCNWPDSAPPAVIQPLWGTAAVPWGQVSKGRVKGKPLRYDRSPLTIRRLIRFWQERQERLHAR